LLLLPWKRAAPMVEALQNRPWQERIVLAQELCKAVVDRKFRKVHELLETGADMNMPGDLGMSAIMLANSRKDRRMLRLFMQHEARLA